MRSVLMTCVIASVGLLPAVVSTGSGSQVQKPLAVVVVGGMMLAPAIILITLPVLIALFSRRTRPGVSEELAHSDLDGAGQGPNHSSPLQCLLTKLCARPRKHQDGIVV